MFAAEIERYERVRTEYEQRIVRRMSPEEDGSLASLIAP